LIWGGGDRVVATGPASTRISLGGLTGLLEVLDLVLGILKAAGSPQVKTGAGHPF
jgi:hypothetical protein